MQYSNGLGIDLLHLYTVCNIGDIINQCFRGMYCRVEILRPANRKLQSPEWASRIYVTEMALKELLLW